MKLEIKHLSPYLPYALKLMLSESHNANNGVRVLSGLSYELADGRQPSEYTIRCHDLNYCFSLSDNVKLILRPMSDLWTPIDGFNVANYLYREYDITDMEFNGNSTNPKYGYEVYLQLIKYHFDVFGLIEQGLAIDINTVK